VKRPRNRDVRRSLSRPGTLRAGIARGVRLGHADAVEFYNVLQLDDRVQVR
jgi:hypothetical protein